MCLYLYMYFYHCYGCMYTHAYVRRCLYVECSPETTVHTQACIHTYINAYIHTYIQTYIHTDIHTDITYGHTYIHTVEIHLSSNLGIGSRTSEFARDEKSLSHFVSCDFESSTFRKHLTNIEHDGPRAPENGVFATAKILFNQCCTQM